MLIGSPDGVLLGGNDIDGFLDDDVDREGDDDGDGGDGAAFGGSGVSDDALGCDGCSVGCCGEEEADADDGDFPACPSATTAMSWPTVIVSPS